MGEREGRKDWKEGGKEDGRFREGRKKEELEEKREGRRER